VAASRACFFDFVETLTMDDFDQFERSLAAALRSDADMSVTRFEPATIASAAVAHTQRRSVRIPWRFTGMPTFNRRPVAAAAVIGVLVVGGAFLMLQRNQAAVIGGPSPTPSGQPSPSELAGPSAGPTSSVVPGPAGVWIATGTMGTPRSGHTAVRLLDGRVLVAGGSGAKSGDHLTSAELYDPESGTWSATGNMVKPHAGFPATLLGDGKVLVGDADDPAADDPNLGAEVYDPASGIWTATGKMLMGDMLTYTSTLLRDGKVLVTGYDGSAELYDPDSGAWTATGKMTTPRHSHAAILLPDGTVLVTGGHAPYDFPTDSAELYDPDTGSWTAIANMNAPRYPITATLLRDAKVLVVGKIYPGQTSSAELYDPAAGSWTATGDMARPGTAYQTATLLSDGTVLVAGGFNGPVPPFTAAELYDPATGSWTTTGTMLRWHVGSPATLLLDGRVLVAGGDACSEEASTGCIEGAPGSAELYVPGIGQ
jgi:hypothetical protein